MGFNSNYFFNTNNMFNLKLKPNQFTILSYLIRMANNSKSCYPSMNKISEMCCVSKSTVSTTIEELANAGYISIDSSKKYNIYIINYDVIESTNNRSSNPVQKPKRVIKENEVVESCKLIEEVVSEKADCTIQEAKEAIKIAQENQANDNVKYAIGVIRKQKSAKVVPVRNRNSFNDFPQRNYTKEDFEKVERMLFEKQNSLVSNNRDIEQIFGII